LCKDKGEFLPIDSIKILILGSAYRKTLVKLLEEHWNETALLAEVDRIEELVLPFLSEAQEKRYSTRSVKSFIKTRRDEINAEMANGMPEWTRDPGEAAVIKEGWGGRRAEKNRPGCLAGR
jgi:hypothetical protein